MNDSYCTSSMEWNSAEALFLSAPVPLKHVDERGIIVQVNHAECTLLGYSEQEMLGQPLWAFLADEEEYLARRRLCELINGPADLASFQRRYKKRSGEYLICSASARVLRDGQGKGVGLYIALSDITAQLEREAQQRELLNWMESCFRSLHNPAIVVDTLGCVRFMNCSCEELVGWKEAESSGLALEQLIPWYDIVSYDGSVPDSKRNLVGSWFGAATLSTKGGIPKRVEVASSPIVSSDGLVIGQISILKPLPRGML